MRRVELDGAWGNGIGMKSELRNIMSPEKTKFGDLVERKRGEKKTADSIGLYPSLNNPSKVKQCT